MLARANRQKLGSPLTEPQLGKELEDVEVLEDLERVLGGEGGATGGAMTTFSRIGVNKPLSNPFVLALGKLKTS
jgi:hypothetical protein